MPDKIAIVLLNMGGPAGQSDVQPFLQNLFSDKAIIRVPQPFRWLLANLISRAARTEAKANYALMGGGSPLLAETKKQAEALEIQLAQSDPDHDYKCFIAMRYWHPFTEETAREVEAWEPDETVLLPLYPHFSSTTSGTSLKAWAKAYAAPCKTICCYPGSEALIDAHVNAILKGWTDSGEPENVSLLMSAHGLPEKIVAAGDPYQWQIERMGGQIAAKLPTDWEIIGCYQSRVGPMKWIGPSTEDMVRETASCGRHLIVAPIAFVSEHIETLVELDIEYKKLAMATGARGYTRIPALGTDQGFIAMLAGLVTAAQASEANIRSCDGHRICPKDRTDCPNRSMPA